MSSRNSNQKNVIKNRLFGNKPTKKCCFCSRILGRRNCTIEHIIPLSLGGGWGRENLTISCADCNSERGSRDYSLFKREKRAGKVCAHQENKLYED